MNLEKYTQKVQEALLAAQRLAQDYQHQVVEPAHLLLALIQQQDGIVRAIITKVSGGTQAIQEELNNELDRRPKIQGANMEVGISRQTADVLAAAERYAKGMQDDYVSTEHMLLGLAESSENKRLIQFGLTKEAILTALKQVRGAQRVTSENPEGTYQSLERYGWDLTAMAHQGKLDPVIGRDEEIRRTIQILSHRTKNNPRPDRITRRRQNCYRRGVSPAHCHSLAVKILEGEFHEGDTIYVERGKEKLGFSAGAADLPVAPEHPVADLIVG